MVGVHSVPKQAAPSSRIIAFVNVIDAHITAVYTTHPIDTTIVFYAPPHIPWLGLLKTLAVLRTIQHPAALELTCH